jgi:hypothetical protein
MSNWSTELLECRSEKQKNRDKKLGGLLGIEPEYPRTQPYYRRNEAHRASGIIFDYTEEEIASKLKIQDDPEYLLSLTKTLTGNLGYASVSLRPYQAQALQNYKSNRFNTIINSRQSGMTLILALQALHYAYQDDKKILITDNKIDGAKRILEKIKILYENLPYYAKLGILSMSNSRIVFDNGSCIKIGTFYGSAGSTLGMTYDFTIVDGYGHLSPTAVRRFSQVYQLTAIARKNTKITILGTPNGENHFKDLVYDDKNIYVKQWIPYHLVPNRDSKWAEDAIKVMGSYAAFLQEYELIFMGTKEWKRINNLEKLVS